MLTVRRAWRVLPLVAVWVLAGCSLTDAASDLTRIDYKTEGRRGTPLSVPPDLVTPRRDERFVVPDAGRASDTGTTFSAYAQRQGMQREQASEVLARVPGTRIERQGNQRWLVVDLPPAQVWPIVRRFWLESGFALTVDLPEAGILETDWAERRPPVPDSWLRGRLAAALGTIYVEGTRDRYRTRLESVGASTEVFISHQGLTEEFSGDQRTSTVWVRRPSDPELETEFLRRLSLRFDGPTALAARSAPTGQPSVAAPPRAELIRESGANGRAEVGLGDPFEVSWRQVGIVLDRGGFTVEDRDRSKGLYFVRYVDPKQETRPRGLLQRMIGTEPQRDLSGRRFQIALVSEGSGTRVKVLNQRGEWPAEAADQRIVLRIAELLHEQLK